MGGVFYKEPGGESRREEYFIMVQKSTSVGRSALLGTRCGAHMVKYFIRALARGR
jgi:hypothetical protein